MARTFTPPPLLMARQLREELFLWLPFAICLYFEFKQYSPFIFLMFPKKFLLLMYQPFHKTLQRFSAFVNWISVRFYETDCIRKDQSQIWIIF